jgi:hypothetical protein
MTLYKKFIIYILINLIFNPFCANADDFIVEDVPLNINGSNIAQIRDQAIENGQRDAFFLLVKRLDPAKHASIATLPTSKINALVSSFELKDEKMSANRYKASLTVNFDQNKVNSLLGKEYSTAAVTQEKTLLLPLLAKHGKLLLWESDNNWRDTLQENLADNKYLIPAGDLEDIELVNNYQALLDGDPAVIQSLKNRYPEHNIIIAYAADEYPKLDIKFIDVTNNNATTDQIFNAGTGESYEQFLKNAGQQFASSLQNSGAKQDIAATKIDIKFIIPINSFAQWNNLHKSLQALSKEQALTIKEISIRHALIAYKGEDNELLRQKLNALGVKSEL